MRRLEHLHPYAVPDLFLFLDPLIIRLKISYHGIFLNFPGYCHVSCQVFAHYIFPGIFLFNFSVINDLICV